MTKTLMNKREMTGRTMTLGVLALFSMGSILVSNLESVSVADESAVGKVQDAGSDAKTNTKKTIRKAKRKVRKATGNDTVGKDIKDKANDVGDDINGAVDKSKHK